MLVLSRKVGERILVGSDIIVTVVRIGPNAVRLGIEAPKGVNIVREELVGLGNEIGIELKTIEIHEENHANTGTRNNSTNEAVAWLAGHTGEHRIQSDEADIAEIGRRTVEC